MPKKYGAFTSSQDPTQIANTVKGVVLACSSLIILFAQTFFHISLNADNVLMFATDSGVAVGAIWTLYGLAMKLVVWYAQAKQ